MSTWGVCLSLQDLLQNCSRGGRGVVLVSIRLLSLSLFEHTESKTKFSRKFNLPKSEFGLSRGGPRALVPQSNGNPQRDKNQTLSASIVASLSPPPSRSLSEHCSHGDPISRTGVVRFAAILDCDSALTSLHLSGLCNLPLPLCLSPSLSLSPSSALSSWRLRSSGKNSGSFYMSVNKHT